MKSRRPRIQTSRTLGVVCGVEVEVEVEVEMKGGDGVEMLHGNIRGRQESYQAVVGMG